MNNICRKNHTLCATNTWKLYIKSSFWFRSDIDVVMYDLRQTPQSFEIDIIHIVFQIYSTARKYSMMMSFPLMSVITTSALFLSSITAVNQDDSEQLPSEITDRNFVKKYGHIVSLHQPVSIEPPKVTCTQGNITLDRSYLSSNYTGRDITYQCAANCSRIYPFPRDTLFRSTTCKSTDFTLPFIKYI